MQIQADHHEGILVLRPIGRLDSASSPELEQVVVGHLDKGVKRLIFDFSELDYISSAGLRVILMAGKKLRGTGGKLGLAGMKNMVREVFEMSGFLALFSVGATLDDALKLV
jgi:anti-anti-sigma factor